MALANYSDLNTAVANWLSRSDLTSRIVEGIALAEAKMNRRLRAKDMVTKDAAFSITGEFVAVPTSFGGVKSFHLNAAPRTILDFMPDHLMTATYGDTTGTPSKYNVQGANFRFGAIPSATFASTLIYYLKVPALTSGATTNWMMTNHPDAYLYGVEAEMFGLMHDWDSAQKMEAMMYAVLDEIQRASNRDTYGGDAALAARPG